MKTNIQKQAGPDEIAFSGRILELIKRPMQSKDKLVTFEIARRTPGVRLIIKQNNKYLITKEFRYEINDYDYRLPGGKVFDKLKDYNQVRDNKEALEQAATTAAIKECQEETGHTPKTTKLLHISKCGTTIEWDLYYFFINDLESNESKQQLEAGEDIQIEWKTKEELIQLCLNNQIKEDRSVAVILRLLLKE